MGTPCQENDPEIFFPERESQIRSAPAKRLCGGCPTAEWWACLLDNLDSPFGVYASLTTRERRRFARRGSSHDRPVARKRSA